MARYDPGPLYAIAAFRSCLVSFKKTKLSDQLHQRSSCVPVEQAEIDSTDSIGQFRPSSGGDAHCI